MAAILYDFPANERVRTFLRLEALFARFDHFLAEQTTFSHLAALQVLFEILDATARGDIKSEVLQELERLRVVLKSYSGDPKVEQAILDETMADIRNKTEQVHRLHGRLGQDLRNNEWLALIKQRAAMPGGMNAFDLPSLYHWLQQPLQDRNPKLQSMMEPFSPVAAGVAVALRLLRDSGHSSECRAVKGVYHMMLSGRHVQLVRVQVDQSVPFVPEASANKLALNIRFTQYADGKPRGCVDDIPFQLTLCNL